MRRVALLLFTAAAALTLRGQVQPKAEQDPYRNFVGHWSGVASGKLGNDSPEVELSIAEAPDGSRMYWQYTFGHKGQKGYKQASKLIALEPTEESMTSQWTGEPITHLSTDGLANFTVTGLGSFTATEKFDAGLFWTRRHITHQLTVSLQPTHLSYRWSVTTNGKTKPFSEFSLDRVPVASAAQNTH